MSKTLQSTIRRLYFLDKLMSDPNRGYSTQEILEYYQTYLPEEDKVSSLNTVRGDIRLLEIINGQMIEPLNPDKRNKQYHYVDPRFSMFKDGLSIDVILKQDKLLQLLSVSDGLPKGLWTDEQDMIMSEKIRKAYGMRSVIGFDYNSAYVEPMRFLPPLYEAASKEETVLLGYRSAKSQEARKYVVHPYYLKNRLNKWYLIARNEHHEGISTYALERILSVEPSDVEYIPTDIDFDDYFDKFLGATFHEGSVPERIVLWVSPEQKPFLESNPLNRTQKVREEMYEGGYIFEYEMVINPELERTILFYADNVQVLHPISLKKSVREMIERMYDKKQICWIESIL